MGKTVNRASFDTESGCSTRLPTYIHAPPSYGDRSRWTVYLVTTSSLGLGSTTAVSGYDYHYQLHNTDYNDTGRLDTDMQM
jgi:hypothetical protein